MSDTAAHLVERVLPQVPTRQWVLSLPFRLRYRMAYDSELMADILNLLVRAIFSELRRRVRELLGLKRSQCGAVTFRIFRCRTSVIYRYYPSLPVTAKKPGSKNPSSKL